MRSLTGVVVATKMTKTATVEVKRLTAHPVYKKRTWSRKKYLAHDELGVKVGDKVELSESKPVSKRKRWQITKVIK